MTHHLTGHTAMPSGQVSRCQGCSLCAYCRSDIGSFLGLALETVSRLMSRFQRRHLLDVSGREVTLLDLPALEALTEQGDSRR